MSTATVRIKEETHRTLRALAEKQHTAMVDLLDEAVANLHRQYVLEETNRAYAALRSDAEAWQEEQEERAAWEATISDGTEAE